MNMQVLNRRALDMRFWPDFHSAPNMLVPVKKLLRAGCSIFAMGSCFALEIRTALMARGFAVTPDYLSVAYDPTSQIYDKIPVRYALSYFDTFTMRQEFEAAFGLWTDRDACFCPVRGAYANARLETEEVYQDPTRKLIYASTPALLHDLTDRIDTATREGIDAADVVVLTLGLTEVWRHKHTGRYLCMPPGAGYGGAEGLADFRQSTFSENYDNMRAILDMLFARYPNKQVVLSVSPIHLEMTHSATDVGTASTESKAILRAVAGQISREYDNVLYFPAYEMAQFWRVPVFVDDGRHVQREFAARVVSSFINTFS